MIISVASIMYGAITYFRHERWEEYLSVIDQIRTSSQGLMEINLANFTKTCFEKHTHDRSVFNNLLNRWKNDLKNGLSGLALSVDFLNNSQLLSPPQVVGGNYIPERRVYNLVKCYWYYPVSVSSAYSDLAVNMSKFGLYGYRVPILIYLNTEVDLSYLDEEPAQIDSLTIIVTREQQSPVMGLKADNFLVYRFDPSVEDWVNATIKKVARRLGGGYELTFENSIEKPYYKWLFVTVTDTRGITVVSSTYSYIEFTLEKHTPTSSRPVNTDDEIYTLEAGVRGQWYWNGKQLDSTTEGSVTATPPIPPIPIKQFRVNTTDNGVSSTLVERPCQYEIWDKINWHNITIDVPRDLANPYYRFNSTNRMVFQVKFPTLDITRQKVRIWWMDDIDTEPYQGPSDLEYAPSPYYEAQTNVYRVEFMDTENWDPRPEYRWPYYGIAALLLKDRDTGECYGPWNIHGFDLDNSPPGTAKWRPYGRWEIKYWYGQTAARAPVRLIAILNSTQVQNVWSQSWSTVQNDYYDTYAVVFITANVKYLQQRVWINWKETKTGRGVWFSWEWGKGETDWYAYLNNDTGGVSGPYAYDYSWGAPNHIEYDAPGYWASHWNDNMGRGLIFNFDGHSSLYSLDEDRTGFTVTHWAPEGWFGYRQGSIEFEAIQCDYGEGSPQQVTVTAGTSYGYIPAMWMYGGGTQTDGYKEVDYNHYMFLEPYSPELVFTEGG